MLEPAIIRKRKDCSTNSRKRKRNVLGFPIVEDNTNNDAPFNVIDVINGFINELTYRSFITAYQRRVIDSFIEVSLFGAEDQGFVLPVDDSNSDFESTGSKSEETGECDDADLYEERKTSYIRRLDINLRFLLLPSGRVPPPVVSRKQQKSLLCVCLTTCDVEYDKYVNWFDPENVFKKPSLPSN